MNNIEMVPFSDLQVAPFKATYMLRPDLLALSRSLMDFGFMLPIVVQKDTNFIIDGNERFLLATKNKHVKSLMKDDCPVIYVECDSLDAQFMHLRLNRSRGNLLAKPVSSIIRNLINSKKYCKEDFEELLQMHHDEFHLMLDGSLLKHRKISEHNYSRAWVPVEADAKATELQVAIERPPNADR